MTATQTKGALRHNEYYDMQEVFDNLYARSKQGEEFKNLYDIIVSDQNILLAYRNIKGNEGSETAGVNNRTIKDWKNAKQEDYVRYVKKRLQNYFPHKVKRVEIPKPNGKIRPLGIPTMEDRLIQQCIKQILEPILEAKFYPLSFGFRPNRSTMHAINEFMRFDLKEVKLRTHKNGSIDKWNLYSKLKNTTNLKEMHIIRYADDFKILCRTDEYQNLVWITGKVHELVHATVGNTIEKYLRLIKPDKEQLEKINKLREQAGNCVIEQREMS